MKANITSVKPSLKAGLLFPFLVGLSSYLPVAAQLQGTFTATGNMAAARFGHTATLLLDGKVLIAGGSNVRSTELYDPATGAFTLSGDMMTARSFHTATLLPNGKVLIAGGSHNFVSLASAELYDPATGSFTATGNMTTDSALHSATLLNNGQVLIAGGGNYFGTEVIRRSSAELYDPANGKFEVTGSMTATQFGPTATLLADGGVLVASPNFFPNFPLVIAAHVQSFGATSEVYSPLIGAFSRKNQGDGMFFQHSATLLPSGKVLLAGGACNQCNVVLASSLLYDPVNGTFTSTAPMTEHRSWHASSLLSDGTVLITGGTSTVLLDPAAVASAEVYAPLAGTFSRTESMTVSRTAHTATLLNTGDVLVTGGRDARHVALASTDLYHPAELVSIPRLFSLSSDSNGPGAIWHSATGQIVSPGMPAVAGEVLSMYTTGFAEGSVVPPQVAIGGRFAEILFFGHAPGYPGFRQLNIRVPERVGTGANIPVRLTYLGRSSNQVTLAVQ